MSFASWEDFLSMGQHGLYVWSAFGISVLVLALNLALPMHAQRRYVKDEARRLRREAQV
ncbi:heme exporter protein D [Azomonas agilis]|uniref:Heme exporter protein D n=1 Tax=Azomonas agilis TaxID=116849 RepID=A0A562I2J2_9GAMM|nr:heme exporter protein CcmD [Azomonas agilis]TWH64924.1 heme exporter protein D [Azomonas agilis]